MKKINLSQIAIIVIAILILGNTVMGASVLKPRQGGTGTGEDSAVGSILVGSSTKAYAPLAVGSNGLCLIASSTATNGISWELCTSLGGSDTQILFNNAGASAGDSNLTWSSSTKNLKVSSSTIGKLIIDPEGSQTITTSTQTVISSASHVDMTINGDFLMTATPSIAAGVDGQILILHSSETTSTLDFQDDSVLAGSDIFLNGADGTLKPASSIMLLYQVAAPTGWSILSNPNQAALGASASLLDVRNTSGSSIAAGKCVYASGYNTGLGRTTIALADADDSSKMPCIGLTATIIGNNQNGEVIILGDAVGLVDTSGQSVGDGVWVSTTAGALVFTRPTVDEVQKIGEIVRANVSGNILIIGAGRTNDIPINATTTGAYNFGELFVTGAVKLSNFLSGFLKVDGSGNISTSTVSISADTNAASGDGVTVNGNQFDFDCSDVTDSGNDGISCSTQDLVVGCGRSMTCDATSVIADAELYTDTKCLWFEDPTADDDFNSIWYSTLAVTFTQVWAESDQTVTFNLQEDDGSPANILSASLVPASAATSTTAFADASFAAGSRLDLVVDSVSGTPTWVSICFTTTKND